MAQKGDRIKVYLTDGGTFYVTVDGDAQCKTCDAFMLWTVTPKGKRMPVNARPDAKGVYTSHFATCEQASEHRKPRRPDEAPARREEPEAKDPLDAEREEAWAPDGDEDEDDRNPYKGVPY